MATVWDDPGARASVLSIYLNLPHASRHHTPRTAPRLEPGLSLTVTGSSLTLLPVCLSFLDGFLLAWLLLLTLPRVILGPLLLVCTRFLSVNTPISVLMSHEDVLRLTPQSSLSSRLSIAPLHTRPLQPGVLKSLLPRVGTPAFRPTPLPRP